MEDGITRRMNIILVNEYMIKGREGYIISRIGLKED